MPTDTHAIAIDAWHRSVRSESRLEVAIESAETALAAARSMANEILEIRTGQLKLSGEIAAFATEAAKDRFAAQDDRTELRRQMRALTESMRHVRRDTSSDSEEKIRGELPTLPDIKIELMRNMVETAEATIHRHSDAKKLGRYNWFEKTIREGGAETVKHVVSLLLVGILGWMAHQFLGAGALREHRSEPIPTHESGERR